MGEANNMNTAAPAVRELARLLLTAEATRSESAHQGAPVALRAVEKLQAHLSKLVGPTGFQALLGRALALAKTEVGWLEAVHVQVDGTVAGFSENARQQPEQSVADGSLALLTQLLGLLVTFIGEALTLHLVGEVWAEARADDTNLGAKETSI